ncbi:MAG: alpha/beta hydrolase [Actinobacteria bacterium]|nr:alpha/beta hydrolase [Actinomycetota bacterium]
MTNSTAPQALDTRTVGEGDDAITYDVRGDLATATPDRPALFLFGGPMDATGFQMLAARFDDRPVITYDPRGAGRNPTGTSALTAQQHAEDLHRVIAALDAGPVDAFGTSGGGVNLLALLAAHPDDVRRAVVHEPATTALLPDRAALLEVVADLKRTYGAQGAGAALAKFIRLVMFDGPVSDDYLEGPTPDPAMFGLPTGDDGGRTDPLFRNMPAVLEYRPDVAALQAFGDRLVIAAGVESGDTMAARAARSVAAALEIEATVFPSDHGGFTAQPGAPGDPDGFAARLREVLDARA